MNCYAFAVIEIERLAGVVLPATWSGVVEAYARGTRNWRSRKVEAGEACRAGDLIQMRGSDRGAHVLVAIDAHRAIHLDGELGANNRSAAIVRVCDLRRSGLITGVVRFLTETPESVE